MACIRFQGLVPVIDPTSFVHPSASLIGDVIVGAGCYIGAGASLRGDFGRIVVETDANVQDNCTLHTGSGTDCIVGRGANIGHGRSEEHTSELQSLMRISYAAFCLKKK